MYIMCLVYCPRGYETEPLNDLPPLYDGEKLLQVYQSCEEAKGKYKDCTADSSCENFVYDISTCNLKHDSNPGGYINCLKKREGVTIKEIVLYSGVQKI